MGLEDILMKVGAFGRFQRRVVFLLCLVGIPEVLHKWGYIFWATTPDFTCRLPAEYRALAMGYNLSQEEFLNLSTVKVVHGDGVGLSGCFLYSLSGILANMSDDGVRMGRKEAGLPLSSHLNTTRVQACSEWHYDTESRDNSLVSQVKQHFVSRIYNHIIQ